MSMGISWMPIEWHVFFRCNRCKMFKRVYHQSLKVKPCEILWVIDSNELTVPYLQSPTLLPKWSPESWYRHCRIFPRWTWWKCFRCLFIMIQCGKVVDFVGLVSAKWYVNTRKWILYLSTVFMKPFVESPTSVCKLDPNLKCSKKLWRLKKIPQHCSKLYF